MKHMDCQDIAALLSALVDDEVDPATRHEAERHLAGCATCRARLDEAERLDAAVASESDGIVSGAALPAGFEAAVIERATADGRRWRQTFMTWTGWLAAAACLVLAVMIWSFDRNMWINQRGPVAMNEAPETGSATSDATDRGASPVVRTADYQRRSWTYDGELPGEAFAVRTGHSETDSPAANTTLGDPAKRQLDPAFEQRDRQDDAVAQRAGDIGRAAAELANSESRLTLEDAQTLHSVALLMDTLQTTDLSNFAEVERIRQIAEYDELLRRLDALRDRLSPADRPVVLAAESVLLRIVRGPVTQDDVRVLGSDAEELQLASRLQAISTRHFSSQSL